MIKEENVVELHYTGKFEDGQEFDSSIGNAPLRTTVGSHELIKGFEDSLLGKEVGDKFEVKLTPETGYGEVREDLIIEVPKDKMPGPVEVGQQLSAANADGGEANVVIKEIKEDAVVIDGNHPLAGKNLTFEVEILTVT